MSAVDMMLGLTRYDWQQLWYLRGGFDAIYGAFMRANTPLPLTTAIFVTEWLGYELPPDVAALERQMVLRFLDQKSEGAFPEVKAVGIVRAIRIGDSHMDSYVEFNNNRVRIHCDADDARRFIDLVGKWTDAEWYDYKLKSIRDYAQNLVFGED